jgi:conjugal transfer pilus assembly protein TraD
MATRRAQSLPAQRRCSPNRWGWLQVGAEVVNDPFIQLLNNGHGAGLRLVVATQTFVDFAARTGSAAKARQVLGNINTLIALRLLDAETHQ